jgi:hypothetical protein
LKIKILSENITELTILKHYSIYFFQEKNNKWGEMIFDIKSERAEVLPITDIKLKDVNV